MISLFFQVVTSSLKFEMIVRVLPHFLCLMKVLITVEFMYGVR